MDESRCSFPRLTFLFQCGPPEFGTSGRSFQGRSINDCWRDGSGGIWRLLPSGRDATSRDDTRRLRDRQTGLKVCKGNQGHGLRGRHGQGC